MTETQEVMQEAQPKASAFTFRDVETPDAPKDLKFSKTFFYEYVSVEDGKTYSGQFKCQRPNLGAVSRLGVIKARLNGGERVSQHIDFMHEMVAYLQVTLVDVPDWWAPEEFYDANILRQVYDHVRSWEDTFRNGGVDKRG